MIWKWLLQVNASGQTDKPKTTSSMQQHHENLVKLFEGNEIEGEVYLEWLSLLAAKNTDGQWYIVLSASPQTSNHCHFIGKGYGHLFFLYIMATFSSILESYFILVQSCSSPINYSILLTFEISTFRDFRFRDIAFKSIFRYDGTSSSKERCVFQKRASVATKWVSPVLCFRGY